MPKVNVYIVIKQEYSDTDIVKVFNQEDGAIEFIEEMKLTSNDASVTYSYDEYEVI
ncbi:hypothetical protein [Desulfosporosinus fructosivorans]|uniref:hypothetical protein n=1 Tax=Desulfosporosinus fructosivorans TaxID=2018669 RepID=UPI00130EA3D9|nr:hypothetical protein [Desulfosporosinus fructosivorans]